MPSTFEATAPLAAPAALRDGAGRILVVDDTEANRDLLARRLTRHGHEVETVESGVLAIARLRAEQFDVVLLDIMMPVMNGYEVLEVLKHDGALRHIPVIVITAIDDMSSIVRCIELGAEDHLPKPFNASLLKARIDASLAKKRLRDREQIYAQSLERELEIGRNIQTSFLPEQLPIVNGWEASVCFRPARQVAGDFYDLFTVPGSDRLIVVVADVCGKGVGAAVFMAAFRTAIRALTEHSVQSSAATGASVDLAKLVGFVNDYIATTHARSNMFTTMFFGMLEPSTGHIVYVNAGHDPPLIVRGDGAVERLAPTGPAVGLLPGLGFTVDNTTLGVGDVLFAFTDGIVDARNADGESFGEARVLARAAQPIPSAASLVAGIESHVVEHIGGVDQFDDITMLALRREADVIR